MRKQKFSEFCKIFEIMRKTIKNSRLAAILDFISVKFVIVRAHFSKRGILKVCKAFLSRIFHAVVFTFSNLDMLIPNLPHAKLYF